MAYAFEDYDSFLASFGSGAGRIGEQLQHNASLSTTLTTDEDEGVFGTIYNDYGQQIQPQAQAQVPQSQTQPSQQRNNLLSPDYTTTSSSPNELSQLGFGDFSFNPQGAQQFGMTEIKQETMSSCHSSSTGSPLESQPHQQQHRVKLADAVPHGGSISKRSGSASGHGGKKEKSSHNMIEKRYRTNINDKIKALRDSVPALRVLVESGDDDFDDLEGLQPAKKLNKATILSKATEYIKHLETKNEWLKKENDDLKAKMYGYSQVTPGSSVSSYSSTSETTMNKSNNTQNNGLSFGNKVLLGGMACLVGTGLNDDFGSMDTRSLFSLPVFGYDTAALKALSEPLMALLKVSFIFAVLLHLVFPSIFQSSKKDKSSTSFSGMVTIIDDVRGLKTRSLFSTFLFKGQSNNDYVKSGIFRCLMLKLRYSHGNFLIKSIVDIYIEHLWTYLKQIKLDVGDGDYETINAILSLDDSETINHDSCITKFSNYDYSANSIDSPRDLSVSFILYTMINETKTNSFLRKFMVQSLTTEKSIPEIEQSLISRIAEYNVELMALFNPTDDQLLKYKNYLESGDVGADLKTDEKLVLISAITQNLIFQKRDFISARIWFSKIEALQHKDFSLLGFTALYIAVLTMISSEEFFLDDKNVMLKIEEIAAMLRIWLGNSNGAVLNMKKRSQLIDFFVKMSLRINGLDCHSDDTMTLVNAA